MRSRSRSTSRTCTSISSPTATTELGWSTCFQDSSDTCTRPSMPPRSTKAPKFTTEDTTPLAALARLEVLEELLALLALGLLQPRPAGQDHVVAVLVELDDLGLEDLAHVRLQVTDPTQLDQGGGKEAPQADVEDETTLDDLDDRAGDHALGLLDLLDLAPGQLVLGPLLGQDQAAVLVLLGEDQGVQAVAQRHDLGGIDVVADRQLTAGDHALGLVPDVQQDLVVIHLDHRAGDELAVLDLDHAGRIGLVEAGAEIVLDDLAGVVVPLLVEGPEQGLVGGGGIGDCGRRGGGVVGHG